MGEQDHSTPNDDTRTLVAIYTTTNDVEAHAVAAFLEGQDIASRVVGNVENV